MAGVATALARLECCRSAVNTGEASSLRRSAAAGFRIEVSRVTETVLSFVFAKVANPICVALASCSLSEWFTIVVQEASPRAFSFIVPRIFEAMLLPLFTACGELLEAAPHGSATMGVQVGFSVG
jgi:hypothetical protein